MTKDQAFEQMLEYAREVVTVKFANELLKPFGEDLKSIKATVRPVKKWHIIYNPKYADEPSASMHDITYHLCLKKTGRVIDSPAAGSGRAAQDITEGAVKALKEV